MFDEKVDVCKRHLDMRFLPWKTVKLRRGERILSGRFPQVRSLTAFTLKVLQPRELALRRLLPVVIGWVVLLSIVCRTLSAHSVFEFNRWWAVSPSSPLGAAVGAQTRSARRRSRDPRGAERALRVLIYARYSTAEQDESSIADQNAYCRAELKRLGIEGPIDEIGDPETSGETFSRPGLDEVRHGVNEGRWDIVIVEDSSRLFRAPTHCAELVETAVDNGIRVVCINDDVDTVDEDWQERLHEAQQHHAKSNRYTRQRIRRKRESLWRTGAAVTQLRTGYRRIPSQPAVLGEPAKGPFFDEKDPQWEPVIQELYERVAAHEASWAVAHWANEVGLPRSGGSKVPWTARTIVLLIRQEVYRGEELHGKTMIERKLRTRKETVRRRPAEEVRSRSMEHLRIVPDHLWYQANDAIDSRNRNPNRPVAEAHPLHGIPRDSRGPLSTIFVCFCGEKMWVDGRNEGSYRCSGAKRGRCWCRCTALRSITHCAISRAVVNKLLSLSGSLEAILEFTSELAQSGDHLHQREGELNALAIEAGRKRDRLIAAIESSDEDVVELATLLGQRNRELNRIQCSIEELRATSANCRPRSADEIRARIEQCSGELLGADPSVGSLLTQLIDGKITAVPYQQFGSNRVVLRAEFRLRLAMFLPANLLAALRGAVSEVGGLESMDMIVDLFEPTLVPRHALAAAELKGSMTLVQIGRALGISKRQAHLASQLGAKMIEAGITDPYIRLTEAPQTPSHWNVHPQFSSASDGTESSAVQ